MNTEVHNPSVGMPMGTTIRTFRVLGLAFLFQFITSIISGAVIQPRATGISAFGEPGDIGDTLVHIAAHSGLMRTDILGEMATALGVVFLGAMLFVVLRKTDESAALVAFGLYILEAALLAVSTVGTFALLRISQAFVASGQPATLLPVGETAIDASSYAYTLATMAFAYGGVVFYTLLNRSRLVPRPLSLWGLITALPFLIGIPLTLLGGEVPFYFYLPYVPFEFVIGLWFLFARPQGAST